MQWSIEKKELNHDLYRLSLFTFIPNSYLTMETKQFIEQVYEIAFGDNAINRNFSHDEVIDALKEINEDSVKWLDREG